jgi:hypothetical protein
MTPCPCIHYDIKGITDSRLLFCCVVFCEVYYCAILFAISFFAGLITILNKNINASCNNFKELWFIKGNQ